MEDAGTDRPSSKVARLIDEYDLGGLGAELEARWTADRDDRMSLRDLADFFNQRLLERRLVEQGTTALNGDVETTYRNLTGDDVSAGVRTETRNRLAEGGLDVAELERDFVTYQAVRSYLREWRGVEYERPSDAAKLNRDRETIQRLLTRAQSVTEDRLEALRNTDRIALREFEVFVDARVLCQECGRQHTIAELFDQDGCDCLEE